MPVTGTVDVVSKSSSCTIMQTLIFARWAAVVKHALKYCKLAFSHGSSLCFSLPKTASRTHQQQYHQNAQQEPQDDLPTLS